MPKMVFNITVILTLMFYTWLAMKQSESVAHDLAPPSMQSDPSALSTLLPGHAKRLLASMEVLNFPRQNAKDINVKSSAL